MEGYRLFKSSGCTACHDGPATGGTSFQKMGIVQPCQTDHPAEGRSAVTGHDADRFRFKVPTIRNVELTYPYFHDGAAETLAEAVAPPVSVGVERFAGASAGSSQACSGDKAERYGRLVVSAS